MPSDSHFAVNMKNQKEAERAEQLRIKNLVLSYDPDSNMDQPGTDQQIYFDYFSQPNPNLPLKDAEFPTVIPSNGSKLAHDDISKGLGGEKYHTSPHHQHNASLNQSPSITNAKPTEKVSAARGSHRARKLQLSDVDWYDQTSDSSRSQSSSLSHRGSRPFGGRVAG